MEHKMVTKKNQKKIPERKPRPAITKPKAIVIDHIDKEENIPAINKLLDNETMMQEACTLASAGFSVSTLAAKLKIPTSTFNKWINDGQQLSVIDPGAPEAMLYTRLAEHWAVARGLAEASLAQTKPEIFLTRGPGRLLGNDWAETKDEKTVAEGDKLQIGVEIIESFKLLREQGIDLNDIIDNDKLSLIGIAPPTKTLLEEIGIDKTITSLPGKLRSETALLEETLNLKYKDKELDG
jgi:hypothetical protein